MKKVATILILIFILSCSSGSQNLEIENTVLINDKGILKNKTFMLTGKLNGISRAEAKSLIEKNSGKIINNVNKKLDYLIVGEKATIKNLLIK